MKVQAPLKNNFIKIHETFHSSLLDMRKALVRVASLLETAPLKMLSLPQMGQWRPRADNTPSTGVVKTLLLVSGQSQDKGRSASSMLCRSTF